MSKKHDLRASDVPPQIRTAEVEIVDPYGDPGRALVQVRDDHLAWLWSRGEVARHEYEAGRRWQRAYELAQLGGARGIDPTRERVDGGRPPDVPGEAQLRAMRDLEASRAQLGARGYRLMEDICGRGLSLREAARARWLVTRRGRDYLGRRFRECLHELAVLWGMATR
jgi:hypothetical protein